MAESEPPEKDVKDFEFRQLVKCRVYPSPSGPLPAKRLQQLAVSSKFDLIFAASYNELKVLRLSELCQQDERTEARERSTAIVDIPYDRHTTVGGVIVHLAVSSDDLTLAVVTDDDTTLTLLLFDLPALARQTAALTPFAQYPLSSGGSLNDLAWNPAFPSLLAVCVSDGNVSLLDVTTSVTVKASVPLSATCLSWSPKGKQIMMGRVDGSCTQYDHDLKPKKDWPAPPVLAEPHQVTDMVWVSNYTYLASYLPLSADSTVQPIVMMTVSCKEGNTEYINYDDVCFGSGEEQKAKYFFQHLVPWEVIVTSSCSATETAIIARHLDDKVNMLAQTRWEHWNLEDSSRAELPVTDNQTDSYPVGMAVMFSSQQLLQLGDSKTHPPCPVLLLLSTDGVLVPFHMAYFHPQAPPLTTTPQPLPAPSARSAMSVSGLPGPGSMMGASPSVPQPPPPYSSTPSQSSPSLAGLLASPAALSTAPPIAQSTGTIGFGAGKSLFGQTSTTVSPGGFLGQPTSSASPSLSFVPPEGSGSVGSGVTAPAAAAAKPGFGFGLTKGETSAAVPGSGLSGKSLFGAFNTAASGNAGGIKPLSFAAPANSGAGDIAGKPLPLATQAAAKPTADKPSLLGPVPGTGLTVSSTTAAAAAGGGGSGGAVGGGSGQFSFSFKPTTTTTSSFSLSSLGAAGTAAQSSGFLAANQTSAPSVTPAAAVVTSAVAAATPAVLPPAATTPAASFPTPAAPAASIATPVASFSTPAASFSTPAVPAASFSTPAVPAASFSTPAASFSTPAAPAASFSTPAAAFSTPAAPAASFSTPAASFSTPAASFSTPAAPEASFSTPAVAGAGSRTAGSFNVADSSASRAMAGGSVATGSGATVTAPVGRSGSAVGTAEEREIDTILNATISQNIAEEIEDFERELQSLKQRMSRQGPLIGTKEEMQTLAQTTMKMEAFSKEITAMTKEHCREMYDLKGSCLDLFAMAEECRCRQERNHDPQYLRALQQRALDPATATRMRRLRQSAQQIAQTLSDADAVLDSQWEAQREKEKKSRIYIPNSDTLYRAIRSNHKVLTSSQHALERVQDQLRRLQVKNTSPWDNFPRHRAAGGASTAPTGGAAASPRDWRLKKADLLTPEKVSLLKESLANHQVRKIKCQPLTSLSQSRLVSIRSQHRSSSVVSADSSVQAASTSVRESETGNAALSNGSETRSNFFTSTPAVAPPAVREIPNPPAPTSFSGIAYFKPKATTAAVAAEGEGGVMNSAATGPPLPSMSLGAGGLGSVFKTPSMTAQLAQQPPPPPPPSNSFPSFPTQPPSLFSAGTVPPPSLLPSQQPRYENVTPTDFDDETGDDEYDEYAGYEEDEEDDDDDEEEAGFGDQYEYPSDTFTGASSLVSSSTAVPGKLSGAGVSKNLFNVPASEAVDLSTLPSILQASGGPSVTAPSSGGSILPAPLTTKLAGASLLGATGEQVFAFQRSEGERGVAPTVTQAETEKKSLVPLPKTSPQKTLQPASLQHPSKKELSSHSLKKVRLKVRSKPMMKKATSPAQPLLRSVMRDDSVSSCSQASAQTDVGFSGKRPQASCIEGRDVAGTVTAAQGTMDLTRCGKETETGGGILQRESGSPQSVGPSQTLQILSGRIESENLSVDVAQLSLGQRHQSGANVPRVALSDQSVLGGEPMHQDLPHVALVGHPGTSVTQLGQDVVDVGGQERTGVTGQVVPVLRGQERIGVTGQVPFVRGEERTWVIGQDVVDVGGQERTGVTGQVVPVLTGQERSGVTGQAVPDVRGPERSGVTGQVVPVLVQEKTGVTSQAVQVIRDQERSGVAGQAVQVVIGQERTGVTGQVISVLTGQERTELSGQVVPVDSSRDRTEVMGQAVSDVRGQERLGVTGQTVPDVGGQGRSGVTGQAVRGQERSGVTGQVVQQLGGQDGSSLAQFSPQTPRLEQSGQLSPCLSQLSQGVSGVSQLSQGMPGVSQLSQGMPGVSQLSQGVSQLSQGVSGVSQLSQGMPGVSQLSQGVSGVSQLSQGMPGVSQLSQGMPGVSQLSQGVSGVSQLSQGMPGVSQLSQGVSGVSQLSQGVSGVSQLSQGVSGVSQLSQGMPGVSQLSQGVPGVSQLSQGVSQLSQGVSGVSQLSQGVSGVSQLSQGMPGVSQLSQGMPGVSQLSQGVSGVSQLSKGVSGVSQLSQGVSQLSQGVSGVSQLSQGVSGVSQLSQGVSQLSQGVSGVSQPSQGVSQLSQGVSGVSQLSQGVSGVSQPSQGVSGVSQLSQGVSSVSQLSQGASQDIPTQSPGASSTPASQFTRHTGSFHPLLTNLRAPAPAAVIQGPSSSSTQGPGLKGRDHHVRLGEQGTNQNSVKTSSLVVPGGLGSAIPMDTVSGSVSGSVSGTMFRSIGTVSRSVPGTILPGIGSSSAKSTTVRFPGFENAFGSRFNSLGVENAFGSRFRSPGFENAFGSRFRSPGFENAFGSRFRSLGFGEAAGCRACVPARVALPPPTSVGGKSLEAGVYVEKGFGSKRAESGMAGLHTESQEDAATSSPGIIPRKMSRMSSSGTRPAVSRNVSFDSAAAGSESGLSATLPTVTTHPPSGTQGVLHAGMSEAKGLGGESAASGMSRPHTESQDDVSTSSPGAVPKKKSKMSSSGTKSAESWNLNFDSTAAAANNSSFSAPVTTHPPSGRQGVLEAGMSVAKAVGGESAESGMSGPHTQGEDTTTSSPGVIPKKKSRMSNSGPESSSFQDSGFGGKSSFSMAVAPRPMKEAVGARPAESGMSQPGTDSEDRNLRVVLEKMTRIPSSGSKSKPAIKLNFDTATAPTPHRATAPIPHRATAPTPHRATAPIPHSSHREVSSLPPFSTGRQSSVDAPLAEAAVLKTPEDSKIVCTSNPGRSKMHQLTRASIPPAPDSDPVSGWKSPGGDRFTSRKKLFVSETEILGSGLDGYEDLAVPLPPLEEDKQDEPDSASSGPVFGGTLAATSAAGSAFGAKPTSSDTSATSTPQTTGAGVSNTQPSGGGFGFSTVPDSTTPTPSVPGAGLFGAPPKFGSPSLFGAQSASSAVSGPSSPPVGFFSAAGQASSTTTTTAASGFSFSAPTSSPSSPPATSTTSPTTTKPSSVFGGSSSVFGGAGAAPSFSSLLKSEASATTAENSVTSTQGSLFAKPTTGFGSGGASFGAPSVGTSAASGGGSLFGVSSTSGSVFGKPAATTTTTASSPFTPPLAATTTASLPSTATATTTTASTPVASNVRTTGGGLFSATTTTAAASGSLFGGSGGAPLFGSSGEAVTASGGSALFGSATNAATTGSSFAGFPPTTSSVPGGLFAPATTTTTTAAPTTPSAGSLFGMGAPTNESSPFGSSSAAAATSTPGDALLATPSTGSSLFGGSAGTGFGSATTASGSIFGGASATPTTTASTFGFGLSPSTAATTAAASSFGFGQPPAAAATTASAFGLGQASSAAATTTTTAASGFGFGQSGGFGGGGGGGFGKPAFGSSAVFGQSPGFGQSSSAGFGGTSTASGFSSSPGFGQATPSSEGGGGLGGSLFGGGAGGGVFGLGAKPSEEKAKQNVFGSTQAFGAGAAANNSLFGNKGASTFGGSSPPTSGGSNSGGVFGSGFGPTTSSSGGVASLGFAVTQTPASSAGGFGSTPAFGNSPAFGSSPGFGSAPAFGGSPAFGSSPAFPATPFGSAAQTAPSGGFSSFASTSSAPTFGSLAQSPDVPSFGNLGQQGGGGVGFGALAVQGGGGFGGQGGGFGAGSPGFGAGSPGFGGAQQQQQQQQQQPPAFGNANFGSSPSFSSYRG